MKYDKFPHVTSPELGLVGSEHQSFENVKKYRVVALKKMTLADLCSPLLISA